MDPASNRRDSDSTGESQGRSPITRRDDRTEATGGLNVGSKVRNPSYANLALHLAQYVSIRSQYQFEAVDQGSSIKEGHSTPIGVNARAAAGLETGN